MSKRLSSKSWFPELCTTAGGFVGLCVGYGVFLLIDYLSIVVLRRSVEGGEGKGFGAAIVGTLCVCVTVMGIAGLIYGGILGRRARRRVRDDDSSPLH